MSQPCRARRAAGPPRQRERRLPPLRRNGFGSCADPGAFRHRSNEPSCGDHVDSHRSFAYVISPYSKRGVAISTNYNTVNVLRTMEDLLGIDHLNQSDADAAPMSDVFTKTPDFTPYNAIIPGSLCAAPVDPNLVPACHSAGAKISPKTRELHEAAWWAEKFQGYDFHDADRIDADTFNRVLWEGTMGDLRYPTERSGLDLRRHRTQLLRKWKASEDRRNAALVVRQ